MSIGTKFNLLVLGFPISALLILLGLIYVYVQYLIPAFLVLLAGFIALDGVVWNKLRSHIGTKLRDVWDSYLNPIWNGFAAVAIGQHYLFPSKWEKLESKIEWIEKWGKYGPIRLYPADLLRKNLAMTALKLGDAFDINLNQIIEESRAAGLEVNVYYAFDHWGLRKIVPGEPGRLNPTELAKQNLYLELLDEKRSEQIRALKESWKEPFALSRKVVSILDSFKSENGILGPKPNPSIGTLNA